jgi:hypothetical protein
MGGVIELEETEEIGQETSSLGSADSRKTKPGFDFLDDIPEDREDDELENVRKRDRKRT